MPNDRKEPIIDKDFYTLEDRVKLTWRDVRDMASEEPVRVAPTVAVPSVQPPTAQATQQPVTAAAAATPSMTAAPGTPTVPPQAPRAPITAAPGTPTVPTTPETVIRHVILTDEQKADLIKRLSIEVEASVRQAISETIELSLTNAMSRVRTDVDRSLSAIISEAVTREVNKVNWTRSRNG